MSVDGETHLRFRRLLAHRLGKPLVGRQSARDQHVFFGAYGATKAAQIALARSWQAEAAANGVQVHILTPAPMPTATRARFFPGEDRSALSDPRSEAARLLAELG